MRQKYWDIIVIGAGASGCMAAIMAARQGARVLLLEKTDRIARKIPATGNGKCNFTNVQMCPEMFRGNRTLVDAVLPQFHLEDTLSFFHEIGILPYCRNGYYYPNSGTASSVQNALEEELKFTGVQICTGIQITDLNGIRHDGNTIVHKKMNFEVKTDSEHYFSHTVILSTGLLASPKLGSDGSAFPLIRGLGHHFTPLVPALCGFAAKGMNFRKIAGVRTNAKVTLYLNEKETASDTGQLQLTDYGVSGIPVFQISRFASLALQDGQKAELLIDFLPYLTEEQAEAEIMSRFRNRKVLTQMNGLLHEKLLPVLLSLAGINGQDDTLSISEPKKQKFCRVVKNCPVTLTAPRNYEYAQVCAGGIRTEEIVPQTLESRLVPGLYFAGELLDVDGPCGGYNLQWAWSSGYVAGVSAAKRSTSCTISSVIPGMTAK